MSREFKPSFNAETGRFKVLVRLSYFRGFEKTASTEGGGLKYRTNGLISKTTDEGKAQIKTINEGIRHFVEKHWAGKDPVKFKEALDDGPKGRWPMFDGDKYKNDDGDVRGGYEGMRYLKLNNDKKIKFKSRRGEDIDDEEVLEDMFRSGYHAIAYFHLFPVKDKDKGGNGIFVTCDALQFWKRDEEFAGGGISDDEIDSYDDDDDDLGDDNTKSSGADLDDL